MTGHIEYPANTVMDELGTLLLAEITTANGYSQTVKRIDTEAERNQPGANEYPYLRVWFWDNNPQETPQIHGADQQSFRSAANITIEGLIVFARATPEPDRRTILQKFAKDIWTAVYRVKKRMSVYADFTIRQIHTPEAGDKGQAILVFDAEYDETVYIASLT